MAWAVAVRAGPGDHARRGRRQAKLCFTTWRLGNHPDSIVGQQVQSYSGGRIRLIPGPGHPSPDPARPRSPSTARAFVVIPGEMAARVDRLPMSRMAWEIALLVQVGWACSASADGITARLYPFIWLPHHVITSFEYSVLYALETGISILIGA
jgi:hypothetical protein